MARIRTGSRPSAVSSSREPIRRQRLVRRLTIARRTYAIGSATDRQWRIVVSSVPLDEVLRRPTVPGEQIGSTQQVRVADLDELLELRKLHVLLPPSPVSTRRVAGRLSGRAGGTAPPSPGMSDWCPRRGTHCKGKCL